MVGSSMPDRPRGTAACEFPSEPVRARRLIDGGFIEGFCQDNRLDEWPALREW